MKKILIANRGEIAVRVIRACQELGIKTVAVYSLADKDSLHTKLADQSVCIGPGPSAKSYLNIPSILSAAEITGADGIHPGYGFLSENPFFAQICGEHGIKFIGPKPDQIRALGDKVEARKLAIKAKVPLLPGAQDIIPEAAHAKELARSIGYPVIIKAAAGGGGRGMKVAQNPDQLEKLFPIAQREAQAAFGSPNCYIEKYLVSPRHIEAQIVADESGQFFFLGERDCTIQRRHQKLVEEALSPVLTEAMRAKLGEYALSLVREVGYQSLGTVEFLLDQNQFYFMEVNTRLQVEHPVTEIVSGVDLVKTQIQIALGEKLTWKENPRCHGHAMECRINAEDPKTFAPWPGLITQWHAPGGPGVRIDTMIYTGYTIPSLYDSMIAKVITSGDDRRECIKRMQRALREMKIEGIRTNIPFHLALLDNEDFQRSNISTNFLATFQLP